MAILSDTEIQKRMKAGGLVLGGDLARAEQCSYSFVPGRVFRPGSEEVPIEFPGQANKAEVLVGPGKMVWIRTLETVALPIDLAGFWWQTNTLSRKGLMLVNMSMVEPGYEGPLACLFVNFGKSVIPVGPKTVIAKMIFSSISGKVARPFTARLSVEQYDAKLRELALEHPDTFLQVAELFTGLKKERESVLADIREAGQDVKTRAGGEIAELKKTALQDFRNDIPKTVRSSFGWAVGALALLTVATLAAERIKDVMTPDVKSVARTEAEAVLNDRVMVSGAPDSLTNARLQKKIDELESRLAKLEPKP